MYLSFNDEHIPQGPLWSCVVVQAREESPDGKKRAYTISYRTKPCVHTNLKFQPLKCTPLLMFCNQRYFGFINLAKNVNWSPYRV